jgi:lipid A ethanolaminephosphotransferase
MKSRPLSRGALVGLAALYFATVLNVPFYRAAMQATAALDPYPWGFMISLPLFLFSVLLFLFNLVYLPFIGRVLLALLIMVSAGVSYAGYAYGVLFDYDMMQNIAQTHYGEALSYINPWSVAAWVVLGLIPAALVLVSPTRSGGIRHWLASQFRVALVSIVGITVVVGVFYEEYAVIGRNNRELKSYIVPTQVGWSGYRYAKKNLFTAPHPHESIGLDSHHARLTRARLVVMVLGETARSQSFAYSGYERNTNPYTMKIPGMQFMETLSCGTATAVSVPCMFSSMDKQHYDADQAGYQDNVLDIISRGGTQVTWIDNDGGCKGICNRMKTIQITPSADDPLCTDQSCYDEALLRELDSQLAVNSSEDRLIVLHMIGSHGPTYFQRYPDSHRVFSPDCPRSDIQNCSTQALVNTYDNTIAYTDYILAGVVDRLKALESRYTSSMMYMSDHGESLGESGIYLHGLPYFLAPEEQTHVPTLIWLSEDMNQNLGVHDLCLQAIAGQAPYTQDYLFHSLLRLTGTETSIYSPELDIFNHCHS